MNNKFKKNIVATSISAVLLSTTFNVMAIDCSPDAPLGSLCDAIIANDGKGVSLSSDLYISEGNGLTYTGSNSFVPQYLRKNIIVTGDNAYAIYADGMSSFKNNINLEKGINVISKNGTAIKIEGAFEHTGAIPNFGLAIKDGSVVQGKETAIDFSGAKTAVRMDVNGSIIGNVIGNGASGNKINFAYQGGASTALFDGYSISGVEKIENWGNLSIGAKDKTIIWSGDFTNKKDATLDFKIGNESDLSSPILLVEGKTVFNTGSKALFSYVGSNINDIVNKDIVLIQSNGGMSGPVDVTQNGTPAAGDLSPLLKQTDSWVTSTDPVVNGGINGNQLVVRYGVNYEGTVNFLNLAAGGGASIYQLDAANYIVDYALSQYNKTQSDASGQLLGLLASAGNSGTQIAQLADQLTPDAEGSEVRAALRVVDKMREQVNNRSFYLRNQSAATPWNFWAQSLYAHARQGSEGFVPGYQTNSYGINAGMDRRFNDEALFGVSFGYQNTNINIYNHGNSKDVNSYEAMAYTGWFNDRYFINSNVNMGYNSNSSTRNIGIDTGYQGNTQATADYNSLQMGYQVSAGMIFDLNVIKLQPRAEYNYQWFRVDDYAESGSPASLEVDRQSYSVKHFGAGVTAFNTYNLSLGTLTPSLSLMGYRDLNTSEVITETAGLVMDQGKGKGRFTVKGDSVGNDIFEASINSNLQMKNNVNLNGNVNYYKRGSYNEGYIGLSVSKHF
ncbi:autotransporter outer membrane beta-barrel domain-containing protein [Yersinia ruckeri]|uniref:autotransporter family protein n=1 Tax=Yersinia ruckeri TaxID=29486 RepID=UPI001F21D3DE|nr:autotransporter outer membrane beta-barrel domain-containing protein [Yersinia ruckeri]MCW6545818.1 autotransporter outer membrane beta-barrel domain-containing protein [Yersinia ruckeri]MCW6571635.1 autotransporter outer membrane beta-barrel domain-containing protein [Yersinia ruckeri]UIN01237.1 autotransporter outer membrane beta-barrel domain-containing protein [Yersinia ruckeri]UZX54908.1 autotransporter outer membrane beta-barrel domain-containing protein [Yersinia ruckeri]